MTTTPNNLNTFKVLYLIKGILSLLGMFFFAFYATIGNVISMQIQENPPETELPFFDPGPVFLIIGIVGAVFALIFGVLNLLASKYIKEQRNYTFIFVIAALNCMTGMLGILLGVFTIIELNKPHVKPLFGKG